MIGLTLNGKAILLEKMADNFCEYIENDSLICPPKQSFIINAKEENSFVKHSARVKAFKTINELTIKPIVKVAFDTRRINQETSRNPRTNLQYWHRTDPFIDEDDEAKLQSFSNLMKCLVGIKNDFGNQPEWFESYSRILYDNVNRILRVKEGDLDIFRPQLSYLEQLIYNRYRLSMDDLNSIGNQELRARILSKDESLLKRGIYLQETKSITADNKQMVIDGNAKVSELSDGLSKAIFGAFRQPHERTVERTITITIRDSVIE